MTAADVDDVAGQLRALHADALARADRFAAALRALGIEVTVTVDVAPARANLLDEGQAKATVVAASERPPKRRRGRPPANATVDYALVAEIARAAVAAGRPYAKAVARHFGITDANASFRIKQARKLGHDIPSPRPGRPLERQPFDAEAARNAAAEVAAPDGGIRHEHTGFKPAATPAPQPAQRPRTSLDGVAHLEGLLNGSVDVDG